MAFNKELIERLLRQQVLSHGKETIMFRKKLTTEALVVLTMDENTDSKIVINISDVSSKQATSVKTPASNKIQNCVDHDLLKRLLEQSILSVTGEVLQYQRSIQVEGLVAYQADDAKLSVVSKLLRHQVKPSTKPVNISTAYDDDVGTAPTYSSSFEYDEDSGDFATNISSIDFSESYYLERGLVISNVISGTCKYCNDDVKGPQQQFDHNLSKHNELTCLVCLKSYGSVPSLKRHVETHIKSYRKCPTCKKDMYTNNKVYQNHIRSHKSALTTAKVESKKEITNAAKKRKMQLQFSW